jgi:predicted DNA binding protein
MTATDRKDAFIGRERTAFESLGQIVEFALKSVENIQLLQGANMIELSFRIQEGALAADISETYDCECYLDGIISTSNGNLECFFSVEKVSTGEVREFLARQTRVRSFEVIDESQTGSTFKIVLESSPLEQLAEDGIYIKGASASDGTAYTSVQISAGRAPIEVLNKLESVYPEIELVGKQSVEDSIHPTIDPREGVDEDLTSKQRQALKEAYFRGYFDWPRKNTAEEIASALGVSSATFHAHHRKATKKILSELFDKRIEREWQSIECNK